MTTFYVHDSADYYGSETTDAEATAYAEAIAAQLELYIADEWPDEDISIVVGDGTNRPGDDEVIADLHDVVQNNCPHCTAALAVAVSPITPPGARPPPQRQRNTS